MPLIRMRRSDAARDRAVFEYGNKDRRGLRVKVVGHRSKRKRAAYQKNTPENKNPDNGTPKTIVTITEPKSRKSVRDIPLPTALLPALRRGQRDNEYYFLTASSNHTEPRSLTFKYKKCLGELGVRYRNFHCLRHTFATKCVRAGVDIKTLSELLGHSSVQITLDRYVHSDMETKRVQIEKLSAEMFSGS